MISFKQVRPMLFTHPYKLQSLSLVWSPSIKIYQISREFRASPCEGILWNCKEALWCFFFPLSELRNYLKVLSRRLSWYDFYFRRIILDVRWRVNCSENIWGRAREVRTESGHQLGSYLRIQGRYNRRFKLGRRRWWEWLGI